MLDRSIMMRRARSRLTPALLAAIIVIAAGIVGVPVLLHRQNHGHSLKQRAIEARVSGNVEWAPFQTVVTHVQPEASLGLRGEATRTSSGSHDIGVTLLLHGRTRQALAELTKATESTNDPLVWSDLAAALYSAAVQYEAPDLFAQSLAACDRALSTDPNGSEPLFNRALVLERLGLRDDAREAWQRYLVSDGTSEWAAEAREHLIHVEPVRSFRELLDHEYNSLATDPTAVLAIARRDPQMARGYIWMEILGRWGEATLDRRTTDAARHLRLAHSFGVAVLAINGDPMLGRAIAAIQSADPSVLSRLAAAHIDYRAGMHAFQENRPADAEPLLRRAAAAFHEAASPMALNADYFAANTTFEQGRHDEGEQQIEHLLAAAPAEFSAYRAQAMWQLGVCRAARANWGEAIVLLRRAADTFDRLGEVQNAGAVRRALAFSFDRIGDPTTAWAERMAALRGVGMQSSLPLEKAVSSIAQAAMMRREWAVADSFLSLEIRMAQRLRDDVQLTDALLKRAEVRVRLQETIAGDDLIAAKASTNRIKDKAYRAWGEQAQLRVEALLATSPLQAEALFTQAINFQALRSDPMNLPRLYLERGRARRRGGDAAGAAADFRSGMAELEAHRQSLPEGEARWGAFHAAEELFEEAVDLAVSDSNAHNAFAIAEAARGRALLDAYGRSSSLDFKTLPAGTLVVEYAVLPSRLVIFTADRTGIRTTLVDGRRDALAADIDALLSALRSRDDSAWKAPSMAVYQRLLEPIATELLRADTLVFVPDASTTPVPFNALTDKNGAVLVEHHAIIISPSAAVYAATNGRQRAKPRRSVLVVANGRSDDDALTLTHVRREAEQILHIYSRPVILRDNDADLEHITERAKAADAIHFAGHAVGDESGFEPASLVLRDKGHTRRIGAVEIAKLRLPRTSVVVLAGCNTARGERRAAEGVISVAHGFLIAGVPSVIATLWPIDDEAAARFFPRLHQRLSEGMTPAEALRSVQIEAFHQGAIPVSLWAALQDIGS